MAGISSSSSSGVLVMGTGCISEAVDRGTRLMEATFLSGAGAGAGSGSGGTQFEGAEANADDCEILLWICCC
jgi:hypothetical protein